MLSGAAGTCPRSALGLLASGVRAPSPLPRPAPLPPRRNEGTLAASAEAWSASASEANSVADGRFPRSMSVVGAPDGSAGASLGRSRARRLRTVVLRSPMKVVACSPVSSKSEACGPATAGPQSGSAAASMIAWVRRASTRAWCSSAIPSMPSRARATASEMEKPHTTTPASTTPASSTFPITWPTRQSRQ